MPEWNLIWESEEWHSQQIIVSLKGENFMEEDYFSNRCSAAFLSHVHDDCSVPLYFCLPARWALFALAHVSGSGAHPLQNTNAIFPPAGLVRTSNTSPLHSLLQTRLHILSICTSPSCISQSVRSMEHCFSTYTGSFVTSFSSSLIQLYFMVSSWSRHQESHLSLFLTLKFSCIVTWQISTPGLLSITSSFTTHTPIQYPVITQFLHVHHNYSDYAYLRTTALPCLSWYRIPMNLAGRAFDYACSIPYTSCFPPYSSQNPNCFVSQWDT